MTKYTQKDFKIDSNGVVRWNSSNQVPFDDMLTEFLIAGYIDQDTVINSMNVRKVEAAIAIEAYVVTRKQYGYSDEEKFEMQAAFAGETVIDIFTGEEVCYG